MRLASSDAPPAFSHAFCNMVPRVHESCRSSQHFVSGRVHSPFMKVWEHIKQEIERRGHKASAAWLGTKCGYSAQQMNHWSKRDVPSKEHVAIASALGTTVEWVASASGRAPKEADLSGHAAALPEGSEIDRLVRLLRPELRELLLAYNDLLPEDQQELGRPILDKAAQMRKYLNAALARQGVTHQPGNTRGNDLQPAPKFDGHERRLTVPVPHVPERRNSLIQSSPADNPKQGRSR